MRYYAGSLWRSKEGERHAIIGPNGAGKSTVFNVITGLYKPSKGKIFFLDQDITGWPTHKIALLGLVRSFQITTIFPAMTVFENLRNCRRLQIQSPFQLDQSIESIQRDPEGV